jgi:hypothetical protein
LLRWSLTIPVMEPFHHLLLTKLARELDEEYERITGELQGKPENTQFSGHQTEKVWGRLLEEWLPPQYRFAFRRHIVLEREVNGDSRTGEVDLVLFHPAYPERLRQEQEVLVSGVVAAFSVKRTLDAAGFREATDLAMLLRRGMVPRTGEPIGELISPLIVGALANSLRRVASPRNWVEDKLMAAAEASEHPREELDLVCIGDLECWTRNSFVFCAGTPEHSAASQADPAIAPPNEDVYLESWTAQHPGAEGRLGEPLAVLVSHLWQKLAHRDASLLPIADGFRLTNIVGIGSGKVVSRPLMPLVAEPTYAALRSARSRIVD